MLGRGGRDGKNAAFVAMLWAGQAGSWHTLMHLTNNHIDLEDESEEEEIDGEEEEKEEETDVETDGEVFELF